MSTNDANLYEKPTLTIFKGCCPGYRHYYALIDCASNDGLYPAITQSSCDSSTLFWPKVGEELKAASPYIVELQEGSFSNWLFEETWGKSWGMFLASNKPMPDLVRHFRRIAKVRGPNYENWYFRYCDPRFLGALLPTCDLTQLNKIMGDIGVFWMEGDEPSFSRRYRRMGSELEVRTSNDTGAEVDLYITDLSKHPESSGLGMKIRPDQRDLLAKVSADAYVRRMVKLFKRRYTKKLQPLSDNELFERFEAAIKQAQSIGATIRQDAFFFLNICVLYGWDFMDNKSLAWIRSDYLENRNFGSLSRRLEALYYYCKSQPIMEEVLA
ncbi:DUF4123 domain-containing protein [Hahella sp. KA22]|uniref:DUF4123 domain-containing protein n=1 Tax=Hahella sp. KA22 TaxID=1628392 RepID=UPI000FDDD263|nr:DUF4123 domain-containing protein [Hahella sp. KA22]AZZ92163.1 DUF4123 domain-containing protein [Hahella sp. KA22]QAY55534.1 DUF4123 domain-containing protein [Hahella sp. KA22]